ncbi:Uncharacterised protein [Salmonella enterica subsp. indica]|uniref:Uncharacterized protein n=1 Tax=Salmonella enterica subsp. indica TaxID=59207 RepID=A0A379XLV4_SALER|nr:Uncharacterised protein [Salmonella enterica subsp. indica]
MALRFRFLLTRTPGTLRHEHFDKSAHAKIVLFGIAGDICRFEGQFFVLLITDPYRDNLILVDFNHFQFWPPIRGCTKSPGVNITSPVEQIL